MRFYCLSAIVPGDGNTVPDHARVREYYMRYTDEQVECPYEADFIAGLVQSNVLIGFDGQGKRRDWALVAVDAPNNAALLGDPDIMMLPDWSFSGKIGDLNRNARRQFDRAMARFGVDPGTLSGSEGYDEVIERLVKQHEPGSTLGRFVGSLSR